MRIAFISDIHGNGVGLRKVLASINEKDIDKTVCLGDICYGGPEPAECLKLIKEHIDFCVIGNTDTTLIKYYNSNYNIVTAVDEIVKWSTESLSTEDIKYLESLPLSVEISIDENTVIKAFHGTLASNKDEYTLDDMLELAESSNRHILYVAGHTHKPFISHIGYTSFLNPGSVGLTTMKSSDGSKKNIPIARYIIVDMKNKLSVEFVQLEICLDEFKHSLFNSTTPDKERLIKRWCLNI